MRIVLVGDWHMHDWCRDDTHTTDHADNDYRRLAGDSGGDDVGYEINHTCEEYLIAYALFCASLLVLFSCTVTAFTSIYKTRLLERAGLRQDGDVAAKLFSIGPSPDPAMHSFEDLTARPAARNQTDMSCCHRMFAPCGTHTAPHPPAPKDTHVPPPELSERPLSLNNRHSRRPNLRRPSLASSTFDAEGSTLTLNRWQSENFSVSTLRVALETINESNEKAHQRHIQHMMHYITSALCICVWPCGGLRNRGSRVPHADETLQDRLDQFKRHSIILRRHSLQAEGTETGSPTQFRADDASSDDASSTASARPEEDYLQHPLVKEINDIFWFRSRHVYQFAIHMSLMLDSFYLSVWVTNLIYIANHTNSPVWYNIVLFVPVVLMLGLISYNLIVSSVVLSVTSLRNKGAEWICDQDDIKRKVLPILRSEVLKLFPGIKQDGTIEKLYRAIDVDNSCGINKSEFSAFLHTMDIHPPDREIRALFRAMDTDGR